MNRTEEYYALCAELNETPAALVFTVSRAKAKAKRRTIRRAVGGPVAGLAAVCLCFVLLVNLSAPFAKACASIPVLRELAAAVSFSPSLSAAVDHDWVQPVGQTQNVNGLEMTLEYVITDGDQLSVFYSAGGEGDPFQVGLSMILGSDGKPIQGLQMIYPPTSDGDLRQVTVGFSDSGQSMPSSLWLLFSAYGESGNVTETLATFIFDLTLDPQFTQSAKVAEVGRWLTLDGQRIYLDDMEIYPTHMRIGLKDDPDNTAWLRGLAFYVEDENGARYEPLGSITTAYDEDTPFARSFQLDSSFFADSEHLTLYITGVEWMDKEEHTVQVDLTTNTAEDLPEGITLQEVERQNGSLRLTFCAPALSPGVPSRLIGAYYTPDGVERWPAFMTLSGSARDRKEDGTWELVPGYFTSTVSLNDYVWDTVALELLRTGVTIFDEPISVELF